MDDYNVNVLSEAKNEYSSRLLNILTPLIILGIKSIYSEAINLCDENNEDDKYLMTFQNFLSRVPKWNANIIKDETSRIISESKCPYLEDLLTCVHITQLKILTSIRVSNQQKKIDIDIPKLTEFIHNVYIHFARKLYSNIYLFEKDIMPLNYQKNMREAEIICRECILKVIGDNMPVEKILRAYIDQTEEEEIIEETVEKSADEIKAEEEEKKKSEEKEEEDKKTEEGVAVASEETAIVVKTDDNKEADLTKPAIVINSPKKLPESDLENNVTSLKPSNNIIPASLKIATDTVVPLKAIPITTEIASSPKTSISFSNNDSVINYNTKESPTKITTASSALVSAPKTLDRLEKISHERGGGART